MSVWIDYREWLIKRMHFTNLNRKYSKLFRLLHQTSYKWAIPLDQNREGDARQMRYLYEKEVGLALVEGEEMDEHWISVFEMLIGLAERLDREYIGNDDPGDLVIEMLENLDLMKFDNKHFEPISAINIIKKWLDRNFEYGGEGSIFCLKYPKEDMRDTEIWRQAMAYISENSSRLLP